MATAEKNGDGSPTNASGVYRHPDSKQELVFQATGRFGNPGADAAVRLGFVYVGPANEEKVPPVLDPSVPPQSETSPGLKSVSELETDLALARGRESAAQKAKDAKSDLVDPEAQKAKDEAAAQTAKDAEKGGK